MAMNETQLAKKLTENNVAYRVCRHPPVFNVPEACAALGVKPQEIVKNLLLKDGKGFFLCVLRGCDKLDFKTIAAARGGGKPSLARPEDVERETGVKAGSVNLFSFPHVLIDEKARLLKELNIHPDDNATTVFAETQGALALVKHAQYGSYAK